MEQDNKTLAALRQALARVNGERETAAAIYCTNDVMKTMSAFVGDSDVMGAGLTVMLDHVGENRADPAEMALTRAVLVGIALADIHQHGQIMEAIATNRQRLMEEMEQQQSSNNS